MKILIAVVMLLFVLTSLGLRGLWWPAGPAVTAWSSGPTIEHLETLSELVCLRVNISDVLVGENDSHRGSWLIKGDALLAIDLRRARIVGSDAVNRTATIGLPGPYVTTPRVDHERTRTWSVEKTTWIPWAGNPDRIRDEAMRQAQRAIQRIAGEEDNLRMARKSAEKIVREMYRMVSWEVRVNWVVEKP